MLVNFENLSYDTKSMQDLLAEIGSKNLAYTTFHNFSPWQNTHLFAKKIREVLVKYLKPITITKKHIQGDTSPFCTPNTH